VFGRKMVTGEEICWHFLSEASLLPSSTCTAAGMQSQPHWRSSLHYASRVLRYSNGIFHDKLLFLGFYNNLARNYNLIGF
jgi:hypothetical protein